MRAELIEIGYTESLTPFLYWMLFGGILALIVQQLFANPKTRRQQFRGQAYPRLGWISAGAIFMLFFLIGSPMFLSRFYAISTTEQSILLHYPLRQPIHLWQDDIIGSGIRRYSAAKTLWHGSYIFVDTTEGDRYRSIVSRKTVAAWEHMQQIHRR